MARILVTGSSDGIGRLTASLLVERGHAVTLHARHPARGREAMIAVPGAAGVLCADLSSIAGCRALADVANAGAPFDAVIHNAAIGYREPRRLLTVDGFSHVFAVNTLAPFLLTVLLRRPDPPAPHRLVYVSSELHRRGDPSLDDLNWERRSWRGNQAYCDTKLHDTLLALGVARRWPGSRANSVEPGWVRTKMSPRATGDLDASHRTQVWLAAPPAGDPAADHTGGHFFHLRPKPPCGAALDPARQDRLLDACARLSGVPFPD